MVYLGVFVLIVISILLKLFSNRIKGSVGELKVNARLSFLSDEYIIINDLMVKNSKGDTSQIDQIVLSEYGIFVIETKNYTGWIFGNEKYEYWTQVVYQKKREFRNPIKQNSGHIYALKNVLHDFPNVKYIPIIVFTGNATLKKIDSTIPVIYSNRLNSTIKKYSVEKCIPWEDVQKIKNILETANITDKGVRKQHVENIHKKVNDNEMKMKNLICPKCNGKLKVINGRNGKFYGCSNYPNCKFTMQYY